MVFKGYFHQNTKTMNKTYSEKDLRRWRKDQVTRKLVTGGSALHGCI